MEASEVMLQIALGLFNIPLVLFVSQRLTQPPGYKEPRHAFLDLHELPVKK